MVLRVVLSTAVIIALYYVLPLDSHFGMSSAVIRLIVGAILLGFVLAWVLRRIENSRFPEILVIEGLVISIFVFLTIYAGVYLDIVHNNPKSFSVVMDRTSALYFSIVTLGTVGYGDIYPKTNFARIIVSTQILVDLTFIAVLARSIFATARTRLDAGDGASEGED